MLKTTVENFKQGTVPTEYTPKSSAVTDTEDLFKQGVLTIFTRSGLKRASIPELGNHKDLTPAEILRKLFLPPQKWGLRH